MTRHPLRVLVAATSALILTVSGALAASEHVAGTERPVPPVTVNGGPDVTTIPLTP